VTVIEDGTGARVVKVLETEDFVEISVTDTTGAQAVILALRAGVAIGVDTIIKVEVVIQAVIAETDITVKKDMLVAACIKEGIQVMRAEAARTRTGEVDQETLITLEKES
jgi:hypothetical protein